MFESTLLLKGQFMTLRVCLSGIHATLTLTILAFLCSPWKVAAGSSPGESTKHHDNVNQKEALLEQLKVVEMRLERWQRVIATQQTLMNG